MSTRLFLALAALLLLVGPADAWAKKKDKKKGRDEVELVGVASMDKVFKQLRQLDGTVRDAEKSRKQGKADVGTAMGLSPKASLAQSVKQLERSGGKSIKMVTGGKLPTLQAAPDAPREVQTGVDAVNGALESYTRSIETLISVPAEATALFDRCKAFPDQMKDELMRNPLKAIKVFKALKPIKNNLAIASKLPKRSTRVSANLSSDVNLIVTTFGGAAAGAVAKK